MIYVNELRDHTALKLTVAISIPGNMYLKTTIANGMKSESLLRDT